LEGHPVSGPSSVSGTEASSTWNDPLPNRDFLFRIRRESAIAAFVSYQISIRLGHGASTARHTLLSDDLWYFRKKRTPRQLRLMIRYLVAHRLYIVLQLTMWHLIDAIRREWATWLSHLEFASPLPFLCPLLVHISEAFALNANRVATLTGRRQSSLYTAQRARVKIGCHQDRLPSRTHPRHSQWSNTIRSRRGSVLLGAHVNSLSDDNSRILIDQKLPH
jgi:hypothetical protein